ncbi:MAG: TonB-dependent receptor, partial [Proteobacteria bacterium]|nr:TonB-dependent receptor [Pseudomonadota bacterium]
MKQFICLWLLAALPASPAFAQENEVPDSDEEIDNIVVFGSIVGSLTEGLDLKRQAGNVVDAVSADVVGNFPDQNSAAALSRLPAVAVQRDQGQERYLQIRGAPNRWTGVSIDGVTIIGADEVGASRAFRFDSVPAVILSVLEVNKTLTPDLSAESVTAQINLRTASPFDRSGLSGQLNAAYGEMDLGGGPQQEFGGRISWSNETFGVVAAASAYEREQKTDNREFGYTGDSLVPDDFDFRSYTVTRENNAAMLGVEFRPAEGHSLFAKTLFTEFNDEEQRNQYVFDLAGSFGDPASRGPDAGEVLGASVRGSFNLGNYENSNLVNTIGGEHFIGSWDVSWRANRTDIENTSHLPLALAIQTDPTAFVSFDYDRSDPNLPILDLYTTELGNAGFVRGEPLSALDQAGFGLALGINFQTELKAETTTFKTDATREFDIGGREVWFTVGAQYDNRDVTGVTFTGSLGAPVPLLGLDVGEFVSNALWPSNFPRGFDINWVDQFAMGRAIQDGFDAAQDLGIYDPGNVVSPDARYAITEDVLAAYGMGEFDIGPATVIAGLRIEQFDQSVTGSILTDAGAVPTSKNNDYTDVFPSINAKLDLSEDLVLRLGASSGTARATFGNVRPGASVSDVNETVRGGNPDLEPENSWGIDASLERYFGMLGIASAAVFHREIDNVLYTGTSVITDDRFDTDGVDRTGYDYITTLNGGNGSLTGIEF